MQGLPMTHPHSQGLVEMYPLLGNDVEEEWDEKC